MSTHDATLALDLGTLTGWAFTDGERIVSGVWDFKTNRHEGGGMRFLRFKRELNKILARLGGLEALYFEEVRGHKGTIAAQVYGGFLSMLMTWCEDHAIPYRGVHTADIKRHATGKGNAPKQVMIAAARARGWTLTDDNEADALWLLDLALEGEV